MNLIFRLLGLMMKQKRRQRISIWSTSRTPFRVWPTDLDMIMHMNNGKYLSLMDLGRMDLMLRSGQWKKIRDLGWYPVVGAQTISYRKSLKLWTKFDLHTRVAGISESGVYMEQFFCRGEEVYAHAIVRARFLKSKGGLVSTEELLKALDNPPHDRKLPEWIEDWGARSRETPRTLIGEE